ncbi:MAG: protein kinase [Polyangiaceae bacterium]
MAKDGSQAIVPGAVLAGTYRALRVIGVGGMGVVVHAVRLKARGLAPRDVAIKFLLPQFAASREAAARFLREARAVTRIRSAHVAQVVEVGTSEEYGPFIAMEYLAGSDLSRQVESGLRASVELAIDYVAQAADALAHAHAVGVVHRDVKPANLFVSELPGRAPIVKVLDFGISKLVDDAELGVTKTATVLGSGLYMSPEQMRSAKRVDHRTDIYGLGVSLYEILTGTQPFTAETYPDLCIKVAMDPPDPLRRHRPDVPEELAAVIARAYARNPDDRYATIGEFMRALEPWAGTTGLARIRAIAAIGHPHVRLDGSSSSIPPELYASQAEDPWRDAFAPSHGVGVRRASTQPSLPGGLSTTASTEEDGSARTVLMSGVGTIVALAATVAIYVFAIRPTEAHPPSAERAVQPAAPARLESIDVARTEPAHHASSTVLRAATPPSSESAGSRVEEVPPAGGAVVPLANATAIPTAPRPPALGSARRDPAACSNAVTHAREACR